MCLLQNCLYTVLLYIFVLQNFSSLLGSTATYFELRSCIFKNCYYVCSDTGTFYTVFTGKNSMLSYCIDVFLEEVDYCRYYFPAFLSLRISKY